MHWPQLKVDQGWPGNKRNPQIRAKCSCRQCIFIVTVWEPGNTEVKGQSLLRGALSSSRGDRPVNYSQSCHVVISWSWTRERIRSLNIVSGEVQEGAERRGCLIWVPGLERWKEHSRQRDRAREVQVMFWEKEGFQYSWGSWMAQDKPRHICWTPNTMKIDASFKSVQF